MVDISRRFFMKGVASSAAIAPFLTGCKSNFADADVFGHGVASGDPLEDRVILWSHINPNPDDDQNIQPDDAYLCEWVVASDADLSQIVRSGHIVAYRDRDYTLKLDVDGLDAASVYYYQFSVYSEQLQRSFYSVIGKTKTLPAYHHDVNRVKFAVASCSNLNFGFFNAYADIARQTDIDAVLHLGDYIYEYGNGDYGDGSATGRDPGDSETLTLEDYRARYAIYRRDIDLQAAHQQHPFIAIWDDHESANNAWMDGAENHNDGEGPWAEREQAARQAYFEWMPIREQEASSTLIYRHFRFGNLLDLIMLDTRLEGRDQAVAFGRGDRFDESRSLLGDEQEAWLYEQLLTSKNDGVRWRVLGQQVMMAQLASNPLAFNMDQWDGYYANRKRLFDHLINNAIDNIVVLTGDIHSSWASDLAEYPFLPFNYNRQTGEGALGVEFVVTGVSSPAPLSTAMLRDTLLTLANHDDASNLKEKIANLPTADRNRLFGFLGALDVVMNDRIKKLINHLGIPTLLTGLMPHLQYVDLSNNGYMTVEISPEKTQTQWVSVETVAYRSQRVNIEKTLSVKSGANHLTR